MKIPPVGIVVGLLFFWMGSPCMAQSRRATIDLSRAAAPLVHQVGTPTWWIATPANGRAALGRVYFGVVLENNSDAAVSLSVSFQSYLGDGTRYLSCSAPSLTIEIAARERAMATCTRAIASAQVGELQITSRLWNVRAVSPKRLDAEVLETGLLAEKPRGELNVYNAFARVRTLANRDTRAKILFRFYSDNGVQLATCQSDDVTIEPEVALRVKCGIPAFLDPGRPQPQSVKAELRSPAW